MLAFTSHNIELLRRFQMDNLLHKKLLDLSDAVGCMTRQILDSCNTGKELNPENKELIDHCQALMDDYNKEKLRLECATSADTKIVLTSISPPRLDNDSAVSLNS